APDLAGQGQADAGQAGAHGARDQPQRRGPAHGGAVEPGGLHAQRGRDHSGGGRVMSTLRKPRAFAVLAIVAVAAGLAAATPAKPATYALPPEASTLKQTPDPGYAKAEALCAICHSRDYITTQPPGKGKEFWTAEVNKMVTVYGAPIPEPERPILVEYLAATY